MKAKTILMIILAAILGGAMWVAPRYSLAAETKPSAPKILCYTSPMHPSIQSKQPGNCPVCGMALRPVHAANDGTNSVPGTHRPAGPTSPCCSSGGCCP